MQKEKPDMQEDKRQMQSRPKSAAEMYQRLHILAMNYDTDGQAELFSKAGVWRFPSTDRGA
jgi:hypothetical protein